MNKRKRRILIGILCAIFIVLGGIIITTFIQTMKEADAIEFTAIDLNKVKDGAYQGEAEAGMVHVVVEVKVTDHKMTDITLLRHDQGMGKAAEAILPEMKQKNTTAIDAVSGATVSSRVIRKAVESALYKGL